MTELERCCFCDNPTGRAGIGEDSIYLGSIGPFCEDCYREIEAELLRRLAPPTGDVASVTSITYTCPRCAANIQVPIWEPRKPQSTGRPHTWPTCQFDPVPCEPEKCQYEGCECRIPQPGDVGELITALEGLVDSADPDTPEVVEHLRICKDLRAAVSALVRERDEWQEIAGQNKCPKCGAIEEYRLYDRVYFDSTPDSPSSACTPAEGHCNRCGYEWQETADEIEETHWTLNDIAALVRERDKLRDACFVLQSKCDELRDLAMGCVISAVKSTTCWNTDTLITAPTPPAPPSVRGKPRRGGKERAMSKYKCEACFDTGILHMGMELGDKVGLLSGTKYIIRDEDDEPCPSCGGKARTELNRLQSLASLVQGPDGEDGVLVRALETAEKSLIDHGGESWPTTSAVRQALAEAHRAMEEKK